MSSIVAMVGREIARGRRAWLAALALGFVPVVVAAVPALRTSGADDTRGMLAGVLAVAVGLGHAVALGASLFGADLARGRAGFDFARPVSALSMWTARVASAWVLAVVSTAIVVAPALVAGATTGGGAVETYAALCVGTGGVLLLAIVAAHGASLSLRSRSGWLALDVLGAAAFLGLLALALLLRWDAQLSDPVWASDLAAAALVVAVLFAAGAISLERGRTDLARCHATWSLVAWSLLLSLAGGVAVRTYVAVTPSVTALESVSLRESLGDAWAVVEGGRHDMRGLRRSFLVETRTGRAVALGNHVGMVAFSADGRVAAWAERSGVLPGDACSITMLRLDLDDAAPRRTHIELADASYAELCVSADGSLLGVLEAHRISIHQLETGKPIASAWTGPRPIATAMLAFVGPSRVRAWMSTQGPERTLGPIEIVELDAASGQLERTGTVNEVTVCWAVCIDGRAERMASYEETARRIALRDARTGALLATLATAPDDGKPFGAWSRFLPSGRVAVGAGARAVSLYERNGTLVRSVELGQSATSWVSVVAGAGGDEIVIQPLSQGVPVPAPASIVDLATGTVRTLDGLELEPPTWSQVAIGGAPTALRSCFARSPSGELLVVDLATGARSPLIRAER